MKFSFFPPFFKSYQCQVEECNTARHKYLELDILIHGQYKRLKKMRGILPFAYLFLHIFFFFKVAYVFLFISLFISLRS